jgi:hypothetical protein
MLLCFLDDAFLLNLPLEASQGALNRFAVVNSDLRQNLPPIAWIESKNSLSVY